MRTTFALLTFVALSIQAAPKPNVVLIMTDTHGAWTLGCYGNRDIRTPNIDALAKNGALFDQAYATNPAWDWQFIVPKYDVMQEYGYHARAVLRPRCSREEILDEYEKWTNE